MNELQAIVDAYEVARRDGKPAVLATVVAVEGSTYRRPGARMLLVEGDGWAAGSISGGCLEGDVAKKAWWRTQSGKPVLVTYDSRSADDDIAWGFGLGCNGLVQVLLERLPSDKSAAIEGTKSAFADSASRKPLREPSQSAQADFVSSPAADLFDGIPNDDSLAFVAGCLRGNEGGVLATVFRSENLSAPVGARLLVEAGGDVSGALAGTELGARVGDDACRALAAGLSETRTYTAPNGTETAVFLEVVLPPVPLVLFGAGHDAVPLARMGREVGWNVTIVDTRAVRPHPERFPGANVVLACAPDAVAARVPLTDRTVAVVMTHNYHDDGALLQTLLASPARYVGVLGPRRRTERLLADLAADGRVFDADAVARKLHAPVGLDVGADNPAEIALSVVAEIQAALTKRPGGPLRARQGPIHARPGTLTLPPDATTGTPSCALLTTPSLS